MNISDFFEKLYSNQYFGIIIFSIIGILAVLFIIVLIIALKDAKKKKIADAVTSEADKESKMAEVAFAQEAVNPTNLEVTPNQDAAPAINDNVVEIKPTVNDSFDSVSVPEPTPIVDSNATVNMNTTPEDSSINRDYNASSNVPESTPSAIDSNVDISQEQNDLTAIAQSLAAEYKKETGANDSHTSAPVLKPTQPEQFSSVYVTPTPMPNAQTSNVVPNNMPNIADIPVPQPIKVENENRVFDSSNSANTNPIDNISTEEYKLK
jgi:hypothetical protein